MDQPQSTSLSKEALRAKRLQHLGILAASNNSVVASTQEAIPQDKKQSSSQAKKRPVEVIDLLSDEDIEESHQELQRRKKRAQQDISSKASFKTATTSKSTQLKDLDSKGSTNEFSVATWNVWFGPNGDGAPYANLRMKAIVRELLLCNNLYCIGFQEVVNELYAPLSKALQSKYVLLRQPTLGYGCAMAIHRDLRVLDHGWKPFTRSQQDRGLLWVRFRAHQRTILFGTTHLESYCGATYTGATERAQQVQQVHDFCNTMACDVFIFNGDMNWDDEKSPRSKRTLTDVCLTSLLPWTDTWLATNPKDPGYTYDPKKNPMFNGGNLQRRFDRCLVRGAVTCAGPNKIIGQDALPDIYFEKYNAWTKTSKTMPVAPSDHFGYVCKLRLSAQTEK